MTPSEIITEQRGGVLWMTMNRPERLNALSEDIVSGIASAMEQAGEDDEIKGAVIRGAGRAFSAGGDVRSMQDANPEIVEDYVGRLNRAILAIKNLPKPVVAQVHGFCAGAGFNLALACDLVVAAEDAQFMMSFVQVGLISDGGGLYFLPRLVGVHRAKELLFLGDPVSAGRAYELGLVNRVVPADDLEKETAALMDRLVHGPGLAIGQMKRMVDNSWDYSLEQMLRAEQTEQPHLVASWDHKEGVRAFLEKRHPRFEGH